MKQPKKRKSLCISVLIVAIALTAWFPAISQASSINSGMRVAQGSAHTLLIDTEGNVWAFGDNSAGQLGDGSLTSKDAPALIYSKAWKGKAVSVAAGKSQSLILLEDGTVLLSGYGNSAQTEAFPEKAAAIDAGGDLCMAILKTGQAVCWNAPSGVLPVKNESGTAIQNVKEIAAGSSGFAVITDTGGNAYQLHPDSGGGFWTASKVPLAADTLGDSSSVSSGGSPSGSEKLKNVVSISAGKNFGVAVLNNGEVYTWGTNTENGVLGQGSFAVDGPKPAAKVSGLSSVVKISAGTDHVIAITNSSAVFGWGNATSLRLDAEKTESGYCQPVSLNLGGIGISQLDCGNTGNILLSTSGEFYIWGNGKAIEKLALVQTLLKTLTPAVSASLVGDQIMTITWNPQEFFTELAEGFIVSYVMPDGTSRKTQLLPLTSAQITLRGLQPATNYQITLSILGKTGYEEAAPSFIVQTAKDDGISSAVASAMPVSSDSSAVSQQPPASSASVSEDSTAGKGLYSTFTLIMIVVIVLTLLFTAGAFVFIWKRLDSRKKQKLKPVRIVAGQSDEEQTDGNELLPESGDEDMKIVPDKDPLDAADVLASDTPEEDPVRLTSESLEGESPEPEEEEKASGEVEDSLPEDYLPRKDSAPEKDEDEFLNQLPTPPEYPSGEDDFIIRKPGELKK